MPARETVAPRTRPAHDMFGLCLLPQGEVGLVLLLTDTSQFTALVLDILQRATAQNTILILLIIRLNIEINR